MRAVPTITRVPHVSPAVVGVFHHEGRIAALVDAQILAPGTPTDPERRTVLVIEHNDRLLGLLVEHVQEILETPYSASNGPEAAHPRGLAAFVTGTVRPQDGQAAAPPQPTDAPTEAPVNPQLRRILADAPDWLARIHDPDPAARRRANEARAREVLAGGRVLLLDPERLWNVLAAGPVQETMR